MAEPVPTPFVEANAILAAQEEDYEQVREIIAALLPGELRQLRAACRSLDNEIVCLLKEAAQ